MKSTPFNPETDVAPVPFDDRHCQLAAQLKEAGLHWHPHAGCFVWDRNDRISVPSPFPGNVYFILNLNRFIEIFESVEKVAEQLVWLPTWHQTRLICRRLDIPDSILRKALCRDEPAKIGEDVFILYRILLDRLLNRQSHQAF